jgi:quinol monooxygenase YgiN
MIVEYIRYRLVRHAPDQLEAAYSAAATHLEAAPECVGYELTRCVEEPAATTVRILWQSERAHREGFRRGPHFPPFLDAVRPFIEEIAEMRHYQLTPVAWMR